MTENRNVYLIGPMGSGKTAVGRQLAKLLHLEFHDSDVEVERRTGVDIPYIFEREGETGFREREREVIDALTRLPNVIVATGGGAVLLPENREHLSSRGRVVYLKTGIQQQLERTRHVAGVAGGIRAHRLRPSRDLSGSRDIWPPAGSLRRVSSSRSSCSRNESTSRKRW